MTENLFKKFSTILNPKSLLLNKGSKLFKQGDDVNHIYFIQKGKIKLIRSTIDGSPVVLHIAQQGETIAEASLFSDQYHCSALADLNSEVLLVKKQTLINFLQENPIAMMELLAVFSRQIRNLRTISEIKNIRSAKERTLAFIRSNVDTNKKLKLELSLKDTAHNIGLAHETFYRELKILEESGIIKRYSDHIKLS